MQYRIKEVVENGTSYYYPQWRKRWFWRRFVWWGGEDGTTPHTVFFPSLQGALEEIEADKLLKKEKPEPRKIVYHYPLAILSLFLAACETLPTNPEWWMERQINACMPTAIAFKEGLNKYGVWSEVVKYHWTDYRTKKARGHAVVAYLYPKGKNQLWSYDNLGSYRIRAFTNNVHSIAQQSHAVRNNPEAVYGAEWIK